MSEPADRTAALEAYHRDQVVDCTRCALSEGRTQVVVGNGDPASDVMFVGEAPGYHEDRQGIPFVGASGKLLTTLLEGIGLRREDVFVANVLKCRPPGNRDPQPDEIAACRPHLYTQIRLIRPKVLCTLGNFATKLLSGRPDGITRVHGHPLEIEVEDVPVTLYPLFHPAAALYARATLQTLEQDFARIPALLRAAGAAPASISAPPPAAAVVAPAPGGPAPAPAPPEPVVAAVADPGGAAQLGLF